MEFDYLGIVFRWIHILAAIVAIGGMAFCRLALMPALQTLDSEQRKQVHEAIRARWSKVVAGSIGLLLISGIYNIFWGTIKADFYDKEQLPGYMHIFALKFVLAMVIFFIASALSGRGKATEKIRQNGGFWLTVNLVLALILVCLSGVLRMSHIWPNP
jgi:uncharacterized membrane protein